MGALLAFFAIFLLYIVVWFYALVSCLVRPNIDSGLRVVWFLAIFFVPVIGCVLFLLVGPKARKYTTSPGISNNVQVVEEESRIGRPSILVRLPLLAIVFIMCLVIISAIGSPSSTVVVPSRAKGFDKQAEMAAKNLSVAMEVSYADVGRYSSCEGVKDCSKKFPIMGDLSSGMNLSAKVSGDTYEVKAWHNKGKKTFVLSSNKHGSQLREETR